MTNTDNYVTHSPQPEPLWNKERMSRDALFFAAEYQEANGNFDLGGVKYSYEKVALKMCDEYEADRAALTAQVEALTQRNAELQRQIEWAKVICTSCGEKPAIYTNPPQAGCSVRCATCWAESDWCETEREAVAAWLAGKWTYQEPIGGGVWLKNPTESEGGNE